MKLDTSHAAENSIARTHYSAAELAKLNLPGLPGTERNVRAFADRHGWQSTEIPARGRTGTRREYAVTSLPPVARQALIEQHIATVSSSSPKGGLPAPQGLAGLFIPQPCADLTDRQRLERDARAGVLTAIRRIQAEASCSQETAMQTLLTLAAAGRAEPAITQQLKVARDGRGRKGANDLPSIRTLKRWLSATDLTPRINQRDLTVPPWAKVFLEHYQKPQKPSVEAAYREACNAWSAADRPSIHQVRRFLDKLGTVTRERGRMGARELKNIQPFIRRDFSHLEPNDIWTADGHTFDAEVQHPLHGRPFRPEVTAILDIATRRCNGWSVDLAESSLAVVDALRYAAERVGTPAIFYVDNGSGYANAMLKAEGTGLMGRMGTDIRHSLPYNSQARGVIERAHQTIFVQAAKALPSYVGAAMDREARLQQFKLTRKALKQGGAMPLIPWDVFVAFIDSRVAEYNARAHRSLKNTSPDLAWRAFEARGWQAHLLTAEDLQTLFRPRVTRTIARGEINLFTNIYFARELAEFHGIAAQIAYDIHDPSRVWVYTAEGRYICEAQVNGNRRHYMPVPVVEQARERRAKGRLARVDAKREEILEELHGGPAIAAPSSSQIVLGGRVIDTEALAPSYAEIRPSDAEICISDARTQPCVSQTAAHVSQPGSWSADVKQTAVPRSRSERSSAENYADWLAIDRAIAAGEIVSDADARWHQSYPRSAQYRAERAKAAA